MTNIENYLHDGANWQAQAVLAYVRSQQEFAMEQRYANDYTKLALWGSGLKVGRFENCREQGYVLSVQLWAEETKDGEFKQRNWAFFEHRNTDKIAVFKSDCHTINTPTIEEIYGDRGKYDYDKIFHYGEILECGKYLVDDIRDFLVENLK